MVFLVDNYSLIKIAEKSNRLLRITHKIEEKTFGKSICSEFLSYKNWFESKNFVYCIFLNSKEYSEESVDTFCSFIITSECQMKRLIRNEIMESDLSPFNPKFHKEPVIYYASLYSIKRSHTYKCLFKALRKLNKRVNKLNLRVEKLYAIGCTSKGERHLLKNGFLKKNEKYTAKYPFYSFVKKQSVFESNIFGYPLNRAISKDMKLLSI